MGSCAENNTAKTNGITSKTVNDRRGIELTYGWPINNEGYTGVIVIDQRLRQVLSKGVSVRKANN